MKYLTLLAALLLATTAQASTVTFTDPATGEVSGTVPLPQDGCFSFRIQAADPAPSSLPTEAVLVTDDTGQMAPGCYPIQDGQTIAVTSEMVVAAQPIVTVRGIAYSVMDCTGGASIPSNPITVEFTPEAPGVLGPLAP
jgi:hypothetical protein